MNAAIRKAMSYYLKFTLRAAHQLHFRTHAALVHFKVEGDSPPNP
jgi:hypothetical protein